MRKGLKGPLVVAQSHWVATLDLYCPPRRPVLLAASHLLWCERGKGVMPLAEDNPSTHKYKNRVKAESSYTQLLSSYWISWLFSAMLYHTCYCCTCRSDICYPACSAPSARLQLAAPAVISSQSPPFDMLHAQGGASLQ